MYQNVCKKITILIYHLIYQYLIFMKLSQYINKKQMMQSTIVKKRSLNHTQTSIQKSAKYLEDSLKKRMQHQHLQIQNKRIKSLNSLTIVNLEEYKIKSKIPKKIENYSTFKANKFHTNSQEFLEDRNVESSNQINYNQDIIKKRMQANLNDETKRLFYLKSLANKNKNEIKSKIEQILNSQRNQIANSKMQVSNRKLIIKRNDHQKQQIQLDQIKKNEEQTAKKQGQTYYNQQPQTIKKVKLKSNSMLQNQQHNKLASIYINQQKQSKKQRLSKQININKSKRPSVQISELFLTNQSIEKIKQDNKYLNPKKSDLELKYIKFLNKLNMIGQTIGHGSRSLKDVKNLNWILPCYFLYKKFYHLRQILKMKCIEQLKKNRIGLEFINQIVVQNRRIKQSLLKMQKCCEIKYCSYQNILNKILKPLEQSTTQYLQEAIQIYIQQCSNIQFNSQNKKIFLNLLEIINSALIIKSIDKKSVKYFDPIELIAAQNSEKFKNILQEKIEQIKKFC